jgi:hypothetical protein
MQLPIDPQQLEAIKQSIRSAVMERDVFIAVIFFVLEAVLLVWLLPRYIDSRAEEREERRRSPTRRIAAERIVDSIRDLLRAAASLYSNLSVADSIAGTEDLFDKVGQAMGDFKEDLEAKIKRLNLMSGGKPLPDVPARSAKESDPIKAAKAKEQRRLNLNKNLFIERNVDELTQSVDDTQRAIDAFLPVFSVEMIQCVAKLYEQLAKTEKPYRALKRAFLNPNDGQSVKEANEAAVNGRELVSTMKELCDLIKIDSSKLENDLRSLADEQNQQEEMQKFLYLHFEGSYEQLLVDNGLRA